MIFDGIELLWAVKGCCSWKNKYLAYRVLKGAKNVVFIWFVSLHSYAFVWVDRCLSVIIASYYKLSLICLLNVRMPFCSAIIWGIPSLTRVGPSA